MQQLFVFTAGEKNARSHLDDSIRNPQPTQKLDEYLTSEQAGYLKSLLQDPGAFYAWGAVPGPKNVPTWSSMTEGDVVLTVYDNQYHYVSSVVAKIHSAQLAKAIWGKDAEGKTWEYMYLLTRPTKVSVHVASEPVISYLNNGYRGFTPISRDRISRVKADYGTISNFVAKVFEASIPDTPTEVGLHKAEEAAEVEGAFEPSSLVDGRERVLAEIVRRRGQSKFRQKLLEAYEGRCVVTSCSVGAVLEAAHIIPYAGNETNRVANGLLLRADIHTLFDLGHLKIDAKGVIHISENLLDSEYEVLRGTVIRPPRVPEASPNKDALAKRFRQEI